MWLGRIVACRQIHIYGSGEDTKLEEYYFDGEIGTAHTRHRDMIDRNIATCSPWRARARVSHDVHSRVSSKLLKRNESLNRGYLHNVVVGTDHLRHS